MELRTFPIGPETQIKWLWARRFPTETDTVFRIAKAYKPPMIQVLPVEETGLPWRVTVITSGNKDQTLPTLFIHSNECLGGGRDKQCFVCYELSGAEIIERVDLRVPDQMEKRGNYSPAKNAKSEQFTTYELDDELVVKPLLQVGFSQDGRNFLSIIKPRIDHTLGQMRELDLALVDQLGLLRAALAALATLHQSGMALLDVSEDNFMFERQTHHVFITDLGTVVELAGDKQRLVDLRGAGHQLLPLCSSKQLDPLGKICLDWLAHRLSGEVLESDSMCDADVVNLLDLCIAQTRDREITKCWQKLERRSQLELIIWCQEAGVKPPKEWEESPPLDDLLNQRIDELLGGKKEEALNLCRLGPTCFYPIYRKALIHRLAILWKPPSDLLAHLFKRCNPDWPAQPFGKWLLAMADLMEGRHERIRSLWAGRQFAEERGKLMEACEDWEEKHLILPALLYLSSDPFKGLQNTMKAIEDQPLEVRLRYLKLLAPKANSRVDYASLCYLIQGEKEGFLHQLLNHMQSPAPSPDRIRVLLILIDKDRGGEVELPDIETLSRSHLNLKMLIELPLETRIHYLLRRVSRGEEVARLLPALKKELPIVTQVLCGCTQRPRIIKAGLDCALIFATKDKRAGRRAETQFVATLLEHRIHPVILCHLKPAARLAGLHHLHTTRKPIIHLFDPYIGGEGFMVYLLSREDKLAPFLLEYPVSVRLHCFRLLYRSEKPVAPLLATLAGGGHRLYRGVIETLEKSLKAPKVVEAAISWALFLCGDEVDLESKEGERLRTVYIGAALSADDPLIVATFLGTLSPIPRIYYLQQLHRKGVSIATYVPSLQNLTHFPGLTDVMEQILTYRDNRSFVTAALGWAFLLAKHGSRPTNASLAAKQRYENALEEAGL